MDQALPPLFVRAGQRSYVDYCAEGGRSLGTRLVPNTSGAYYTAPIPAPPCSKHLEYIYSTISALTWSACCLSGHLELGLRAATARHETRTQCQIYVPPEPALLAFELWFAIRSKICAVPISILCCHSNP